MILQSFIHLGAQTVAQLGENIAISEICTPPCSLRLIDLIVLSINSTLLPGFSCCPMQSYLIEKNEYVKYDRETSFEDIRIEDPQEDLVAQVGGDEKYCKARPEIVDQRVICEFGPQIHNALFVWRSVTTPSNLNVVAAVN